MNTLQHPLEAPPDPWQETRRELGLDDHPDACNLAVQIVDRHVDRGRGGEVAMRFIAARDVDECTDLTYDDLLDRSARVAGVLLELGLRRGDTVSLLAGRVPLLYLSALGVWRAGGVACPLFAAFGPEPIRQRLELGQCRILITTSSIYRRKIAAMRAELPLLEHVLVIDVDAADAPDGTESLPDLLLTAEPVPAARTLADDPATLHFTSGTTGTPKGAVLVHEAVVSHAATGRSVFAFQPDDVYWCTADPGWVTGTSYGIVAPLAAGVRMVVDEAEFDADRWYQVLEREQVTVWYTAPTAIRMLMRAGRDAADRRDLGSLRLVASVGEPLSTQAVEWGRSVLGQPIRDTWWQTETGAIVIANGHDVHIRPGSMGRPVDGLHVTLLQSADDGELTMVDGRTVEVVDHDEIGMIAIRPGWPSMFREYLNAHERYRSAFVDGWYISGDLARRDEDGYYWFIGRADDVIKTAGHLIGPFEVESVLMEHDDVVGAGVYGMPDPVAGDVIHAEIVLRSGAGGDETLQSVKAHARRRLGASLAPRSIVAVEQLPYTRSGKVMRRLLRARALGLPEGDTSTLEGNDST